jgi:methyl-accepting chemotaxis protein
MSLTELGRRLVRAPTEEMTASAESASHASSGIAAVAKQHSAVADEVSASAVDVSQQVEQMSIQARELAATADHLRSLVSGFRLDTNGTAPAAAPLAPRNDVSSGQLARVGD